MSDKRRVVITGLGLITPVGLDVTETWDSLVAGVSGAAPITRFDASGHAVRFACEVKGFDPEVYMDRKEVRRADRFLQLAIGAAQQAAEQAGLPESVADVDAERFGVIVGSGIGGLGTLETQHSRMLDRGPDRVSPFFIPMFIGDMAAGMISMRYVARGPNYATVSACASSGHAVGAAFRSIRTGETDVMITGGTEPETASRPFDATRDGFVLGEGAGMLVLESEEHALARGATVLAELTGFGQSADAYHMTSPAPEGAGAQIAMRLALQDSGLHAEDIGYINAHGTSTPANDSTETAAIKFVFGDHSGDIVVGSTKSMTGHTLGAAGAIEAAVTALVCERGVIPPTINYRTPDPECDLNYGTDGAVKQPVRAGLTNSFGFGGHNVSLVFRRWEGR
jgi:3-oxoacyl-[acyl-carrier-protein] synthase II